MIIQIYYNLTRLDPYSLIPAAIHDECLAKYKAMITEALTAEYPTATITVEENDAPLEVRVVGDGIRMKCVRSILDRVQSEWVVWTGTSGTVDLGPVFSMSDFIKQSYLDPK